MRFWKKRTAASSEYSAESDRILDDVLQGVNQQAVDWTAAGRPAQGHSAIAPLGSLGDPDQERAASLEAAAQLLAGSEPEPGIGSLLGKPPQLTEGEEEFSARLFDLNEETLISRTPFKHAICYRAAMNYTGGWSTDDHAQFDRLLSTLDDQAIEHPVGSDDVIPEEVRVAAGDLYRFLIRVGCA